MQINELLIKPKKPKAKKKKVLKEGTSLLPEPQEPIIIGGISFVPPFYPMADKILDKNNQLVCVCVNNKIAKVIADLMWEHL